MSDIGRSAGGTARGLLEASPTIVSHAESGPPVCEPGGPMPALLLDRVRSMSPQEIAEMVFEDGWNRAEFARVTPVLADEFPIHIGGETRLTNSDELEATVARWREAFPDLRFVVHSITASEEIAAVRATLHGTHRGTWSGYEPTGRRIRVEHAFFLRIEHGLVVEVWEILDRSDLVRQLTHG